MLPKLADQSQKLMEASQEDPAMLKAALGPARSISAAETGWKCVPERNQWWEVEEPKGSGVHGTFHGQLLRRKSRRCWASCGLDGRPQTALPLPDWTGGKGKRPASLLPGMSVRGPLL